MVLLIFALQVYANLQHGGTPEELLAHLRREFHTECTIVQLSMQCPLFCATRALLYDERLKTSEKIECIPLIFRRSSTLRLRNNSRIFYGSEPKSLRTQTLTSRTLFRYVDMALRRSRDCGCSCDIDIPHGLCRKV